MASAKTRMLWQFMAGQRGRYMAAIGVMAGGVGLGFLAPLVVRAIIDGLLRHDQTSGFSRLVLRIVGAVGGGSMGGKLAAAGGLIVALSVLSGALMYFKSRWSAIASERIARSLRERLYDHLQHLPCSYHDKAQTGDLVQRCTSDVDTVRMFYSSQVIDIARALILLATALPILMFMDWRLALVGVSLLPVIVLFSVFFFARVRGAFKSMDEAEGAMTTVLQENLTGIRVVRAFARQDFEKAKFGERNRAFRDKHYKLFRVMAIYWSSSDLMCLSQMALVLLYGAARATAGRMTIGTLLAFLMCSSMYIWPVRMMGRILTELGKAMVSLGRIQEILEAKAEPGMVKHGGTETRRREEEEKNAECKMQNAEVKSRARGSDLRSEISDSQSSPLRASVSPCLTSARGEIELRDMSFSHAGKAVLSGINLHVQPGETLAILGPSGSGKSTLINLLLRFYDYEQGSILLDGREIREMDRKAVRSNFGVVMQEPFLYSKSLRENIKIGRHEAADEQMVEAAEMAAIHESVQGFDKQYDTLVGERGVTLSGGQRQRVAIARALLQEPPILVLDDALSAVDTHTETLILEAFKRRHGRQTTLVIAHRLSTLMHADRIIVLEHGRIVQCGPHEQLVNEEGLYRRLWQIQGALEEDLRSELEAVG